MVKTAPSHTDRFLGLVGLVTLTSALSACGTESPPELSVRFPLMNAISDQCADPSNLAGITAVIRVGGHDDCPLTVDPVTLEASGTCDAITIGIARPLMLAYFTGSAPVVPLAYMIGWVDLARESLPAGDTLAVALGDPATSCTVIDDPKAAALANPPDTTEPNLRSAKQWAAVQIENREETLDDDDDTCPNLVEACNGTLGALDMNACPPYPLP